LLLRWNAGDRQALEELTPVLYDDLRRLARDALRRESPGHTLSATGLVHEAYMRLVDQRRVRWENSAHFFGVAAHLMRRILVDHARARAAAKRGGSAPKLAITDDMAAVDGVTEDVLDLDAALVRLAEIDARKVQVVEMKFFAGMTNGEVAEALSVSEPTVERDWKLARAWLVDAMGGPKD
jgi:RNA polymerase sigma factor (TIGR02999 family)